MVTTKTETRLQHRFLVSAASLYSLTTANANVFYELGIRHGIRPHSTVLIFGRGSHIPFDVYGVKGLPYSIDAHGNPGDPKTARDALAKRLRDCHNPVEDSPLFQLIDDWPRPDIARLKTDTFRSAIEYSREYKKRLEDARTLGKRSLPGGRDAVAAIEGDLRAKHREGKLHHAEPAILVDLLLSYRAVDAYQEMADLVDAMSRELARTVLVQEQHAFALNRLGCRDEAENKLRALIQEHGPSSETNGLLGRVYKDKWEDASKAGLIEEARGYLGKAVRTYLDGFRTDIRDVFPGVNAATLMECQEPIDDEQAAILPVIEYAVKMRLASKTPDYWDHASLLELSILQRNRSRAQHALSEALACVREPWEPRTTARNLRLIREARARRLENGDWIRDIETALLRKSGDA